MPSIAPMPPEFIVWHRTLVVEGSNSDATRYWEEIAEFRARITTFRDAETVVRIALRSKQRPHAESVARVRAALQEVAPDLASEGAEREFELSCAAVCMNFLLARGSLSAEIALLLSTGSVSGKRAPQHCASLCVAAEAALLTFGDRARQRPPLKLEALTKLDENAVALSMRTAPPEDAAAHAARGSGAAVQHVASYLRSLQRVMNIVDQTLKAQDEELQMLWWLMGGTSKDLATPFTNLGLQRPLVLAKELAAQTTQLPGPRSVEALLARSGISRDLPTSVSQVVNAADTGWLERVLGNLTALPSVLPLHAAIAGRLETGDAAAWIPAWNAATSLDASVDFDAMALALQFYRERLIAREIADGN